MWEVSIGGQLAQRWPLDDEVAIRRTRISGERFPEFMWAVKRYDRSTIARIRAAIQRIAELNAEVIGPEVN